MTNRFFAFGCCTLLPLAAMAQQRPNIIYIMSDQQAATDMSCAGNNDVKTWKPDTLRCLAGTEKAWFKFVVACEDDVRAVLRRASEADIPPERILIMPLASTQDELNAMRAQTVEWCLRYGLRFSDRLHIAIWDSKKGV